MLRDATVLVERLRQRAPRVQCLTNTVAQAITANALLALGARVSMAIHPAEIADMTRGADAVLINFGTIDEARMAGIRALFDSNVLDGKPVVLDPVFVEFSQLRMELAARVLSRPGVIVKGNGQEIAALRARGLLHPAAIIAETGAVDVVTDGNRRVTVSHGHPLMAQVTGMGCAAGAVIAAFAAIEPDALNATAQALAAFGRAGENAARTSAGPGTFAAQFVDALSMSHQTRSE